MSASQEQAATRVFLADMHVVLTQGNTEMVRIPIRDIKLIGEYTTSEGPFVDDWFIVFMTSDKDWKQISAYTPGMLEMLNGLGDDLKAEIVGSLAASTSWKTNIIWPRKLEGQAMWDVHTEPALTLGQKLKEALGIGSDKTLVLTPAASSVFY